MNVVNERSATSLRVLRPVSTVAGVLLLLAGLVACTSDGSVAGAGAPPRVEASIVPLPPSTVDAIGFDDVAVGQRARFAYTADGVALPDPNATPGAVFADVQAADICDLHYTQSVRQPRFNVKVDAFVSYGVSIHERNEFQVDHLVPISLGGSNDPTNLWPQLYAPESGAAEKDLLERQLRGLVCSNVIPLPEAQGAYAANWWQAYQTYMGRPILPGSDGQVSAEPETVEPGEVVNGAALHERGRGRLHRPQEHPPHVRDDEHGHVGMVEAFVMLARRLALIGLMLVCGIATRHTRRPR